MNFYNDNDRYVAQWLRNLIEAGYIGNGIVDERSITEIKPEELAGYSRCHFFAGISGWKLALNFAEWPAEIPVWTGSCPCQPFSTAGKRKADEDKRHLWPIWFELIRVCRPPAIFGEQVEAAIGIGWLDRVFDDLEAEGYTCGAAVLPACSVGAPHIRQRLWWVAFSQKHGFRPFRTKCQRLQRGSSLIDASTNGGLADAELRRSEQCDKGKRTVSELDANSAAGRMADSKSERKQPSNARRYSKRRFELAWSEKRSNGRNSSTIGRPTLSDGWNAEDGDIQRSGKYGQQQEDGGIGSGMGNTTQWRRFRESGSLRSIWTSWTNSQWIYCKDGKYRRIPLESALQPLAPRIPGRVGQLRAAGNAIVPQVAAEFIKAVMGD